MKLVFINDNERIRKTVGQEVKDGGLSRNFAWEKKLTRSRIENIVLTNTKAHILQVFKAFLQKNKTIFSLYPTVGIAILNNGLERRFERFIYFYLIKKAAEHNRVVFDVCDLKYEQAIDLDVNQDKLDIIKKVENRFFQIENLYYIFASYTMRDYAVKKYHIPVDHTDVCINGSNRLILDNCIDVQFSKDTTYFVYAGTLNAGRNIEKMIDSFPEQSDKCLILMGINGEWINEKFKSRSNIKYLGAVAEDKCHYIVSKCDIGLIPYDENREYYNVAYPTKLSFYITAGIPIISTPVKEVLRVNEEEELGWNCPLESWGSLIEELSYQDIILKRGFISRIRDNFLWENTLESVFLK